MMRPRYENRLTRADVGRRVTVRRWVPDDERGVVPSDVVGHLDAWGDDDVLHVRRRSGEVVAVALDDVLAAKVIPDVERT